MDKEQIPNSLESQVRAAYSTLREQGATSPDSLDPSIPEVAAANALFEEWVTSIDSNAGDDQKLRQLANLQKTIFYVDLGFTDRAYLLDVKTWLSTDIDDAADEEVRQKIQEQIDKVEALLAKTE